jgi:L-ascorbate metabolism protein UlaG (beta-lactamase superfamily)
MNNMLEKVHWLGHSGFMIKGWITVYVDPYRIKRWDPADVILITHNHYDHFSPEDVRKILKPSTVIVKPGRPEHDLVANYRSVAPGDELEIKGLKIHAVHAYNIGKLYHPESAGHVGYVFTVEGVTYYHAGDSDFIMDMEDICCDVAFLPVGGTFTMNAEEAAQAAAAIRPKIAVPIHWDHRHDAERFAELAECEVRIMEIER